MIQAAIMGGNVDVIQFLLDNGLSANTHFGQCQTCDPLRHSFHLTIADQVAGAPSSGRCRRKSLTWPAVFSETAQTSTT